MTQCRAVVAFVDLDRHFRRLAGLPEPIAKEQEVAVIVDEYDEAYFFHDVDLTTLGLDASRWKHQDHYAILGLGKLRHRATAEHIRLAYRKRILQYHPDKRPDLSSRQFSSLSGESLADNIFKCLQRAYQTVSDAGKRQQWDSVDFDEKIPTAPSGPMASFDEFARLYEPVFSRNARFSQKQPVPSLGSAFSTKDEVLAFYEFWRRFDSWRRFEWLDEDEEGQPAALAEDQSGNRADRRWLDRKNRATRAKLKAEDNARLAQLVENAAKADPRMHAIRQQERQERSQRRRPNVSSPSVEASTPTVSSTPSTTTSAVIDEELERERQKTKEREKAEKATLRLERKTLRDFWATRDYCAAIPTAANSQKVRVMEERAAMVEQLATLLDLLSIQSLNQKLSNSSNEQACEHLQQAHAEAKKPSPIPTQSSASSTTLSSPVLRKWTADEIDALILAVKAFPPGTADRWQRITDELNKSRAELLTVEEVLKEAALLKETPAVTPSPILSSASIPAKKRDSRIDAAAPTISEDRLAASLTSSTPSSSNASSSIWTAEQQAALERALKQFPTDQEDRWDRIAEAVGRSRKDCQARVRDIVLALKTGGSKPRRP